MGILDSSTISWPELNSTFASREVVTPNAVREGRVLALGDLAAWSDHASGTGSVTIATDPEIGTYVRIATAAQSAYQAGRDLPVRMGNGRAISFLFRRNDPNLSVLDLYAGVSAYDTSTYLRWNKGVAGLDVGVWRRVIFVPSEYEGTKGNLTDPTDVRWIALRLFSATGTDTSVDVADFRVHDPDTKATVSFMFDDGRDDTYAVAFPRMSTYGWAAGVPIEHDRVGTVGRVTLTQLHEMYDAGWEVHGHHTAQMTTLSDAEQVAVHRASKAFLASNGFSRGDRIWAWPGGAHNRNAEAIALRYWQTLRRASPFTVHGAAHIYEAIDPSIYYQLAGRSLAQAKAAIDRAVMAGSSLVFAFHGLKDTISAAEDWLTTDFDALLAYIAAAGVNVVPPGEVWTQ